MIQKRQYNTEQAGIYKRVSDIGCHFNHGIIVSGRFAVGSYHTQCLSRIKTECQINDTNAASRQFIDLCLGVL